MYEEEVEDVGPESKKHKKKKKKAKHRDSSEDSDRVMDKSSSFYHNISHMGEVLFA